MKTEKPKASDRLRDAPKRIALAVSLCAVGLTAVAQSVDEDASPSRLTVSAGGQVGTDAAILTSADLRVIRQTRTQQLTFNLSGSVIAYEDDGFEPVLSSPTARLSYSHDGGPVQLTTAFSYAKTSVDGVTSSAEAADGLSPSDFLDDDGERIDRSAQLGLEFGARSRFGTTINLSYSDVTFEDTTSTALFDSQTVTADIGFRLDVTDVFQLRPGYSFQEVDRDNLEQTLTTRQIAQIAATYQINPVTSVDATLALTRIETTENDALSGLRETQVKDGAGFQLGATLTRKTGDMRLQYGRNVETDNNVDSLTFSHTLELSRTQQLDYSIGVASYGDETAVIGSLGYAQALKNGQFSLGFDQSVTQTDTDETAVSTTLTGRYQTALTARGDLLAGIELSRLDTTDPAESDFDSVNLSVGYRHTLNRDWSVDTSLAHNVARQDGVETNSTTNLSLSLNRTFSLFR